MLVETMRQLGRKDRRYPGREAVDLEALSEQVLVLIRREASRTGVEIRIEHF